MSTSAAATGAEESQESWPASGAKRYKVIPLRATGVTPEAVAQQMEEEMNDASLDGRVLERIQPVIYNSSTTGYLLLVFAKANMAHES